MSRRLLLTGLVGLLLGWMPGSLAQEVSAQKPAALILVGRAYAPNVRIDFDWLTQVHQRGVELDVHYTGEKPPRPVTWELLRNYTCLILLNPPPAGEGGKPGADWPDTKGLQELLDRYLAAGGGIYLMPNLGDAYGDALRQIKNWETYLSRWGAQLPLDRIQDPAGERQHPRNQLSFLYTDKVLPGPVSDGIKGIWFPAGGADNWAFNAWGHALEVSTDWNVVVRGSDASSTRPMTMVGVPGDSALFPTMFHRPDQKTPPTLFAIREQGAGRLALTATWAIFTLYGGKSWIHDGIMIDKGLAGRPTDFGRLFENTLRWLSEPGLKSGALGGYTQNPLVLKHPNLSKKPDEYFPQFGEFQNPTPPGTVYRGLIGARTAYSSGSGTVADYAAAATAAGLDFIVFLEEFGKDTLTEANYRKLEADCRAQSTATLLLLPGFSFKNNIGNHMFAYGSDLAWPSATQVTGDKRNEWRLQCFDKDGKLAHSDEDAKNWLWTIHGCTGRNVGYYNFADHAGVPVRNLRLFGLLGVMTYLDGKLVEDVTPEYLDYVMDGDAPLAGAIDLVRTPQELTRAVQAGHYLTHVAAQKLADLPGAMQYGHAYGRANVYPSSGPQIKAWASTQRVLTYAGESFVPVRYRIRPLCWVTSDVGLKEIVIYNDGKPYRRFLLNGAKEFKQTFEWAYDRQRNLTLEITDVKGGRALSAAFEMWSDANFHQWCSDRQNGAIWHGPGSIGGAAGRIQKSVGPTWDGGPPPQPYAWYRGNLSLTTAAGEVPGPNEGNQFLTCVDETVFATAIWAGHQYVPGEVGNAYTTLGPIVPHPLITGSGRSVTFLPRISGPNLDWHAMWTERAGGQITLCEGEITFTRDTEMKDLSLLQMRPESFPADGGNIALAALRRNNAAVPVCGAGPSFYKRGQGFLRALGIQNDLDNGRYVLDRGGYTALFPSGEGSLSMLFNLSDRPFRVNPWGWWDYTLAIEPRLYKTGETLRWQYLVVVDPLDQPAKNLARIERIRGYYGLDGQPRNGLTLKRGTLTANFGVADLAPVDGIVEFEVPAPDFELDLPLGLRFTGFNPNWTIGQFQLQGYSPGFYTDGKNVYRNLGTDDRDQVHLAVYTKGVPLTRCVVGHPVQCDNPRLIIELAQLNSKPAEYHVAVNNPTDAPLKTVLKKAMDLPGFAFPDTPVEVPAGGYLVVREK